MNECELCELCELCEDATILLISSKYNRGKLNGHKRDAATRASFILEFCSNSSWVKWLSRIF